MGEARALAAASTIGTTAARSSSVALRASASGRVVSGRVGALTSGLELRDLVEDRLAAPVGRLVGPHGLELVGAEAVEPGHDLRRREAVVVGDRQVLDGGRGGHRGGGGGGRRGAVRTAEGAGAGTAGAVRPHAGAGGGAA